MHSTIPVLSTALALGLSLSLAQAQGTASLQIFGRMDVGLTSFKGVDSKTTTLLSSGIGDSSSVGFKGEEDMGGGYKAFFVLEHGLYADTGGTSQDAPISGIPAYTTAGISDPGLQQLMQDQLGGYLLKQLKQDFWGRQTLVGLITPVGAVMAGRSYTPAYEIFDRYDPMESGNVAEPYALLAVPVGLEIRTSHSLQYRIEQGGWSGALTWGASSLAANPSGRFYGFHAGYENKAFSIGLAHQARQNSQGQTGLTTSILGAWWRISAFKLMGSYIQARDQHPQGGVALQEGFSAQGAVPAPLQAAIDEVGRQLQVDSRVLSLGVQYQATPNLRLIANHAQLLDGKLAQGDATLWGTAAEYALSKRTSLWSAWSRINNEAQQQIAPVTSGTLIGFANAPGQTTMALQLSVVHKF